jgi:hypothetical protein
VPNSIGGDGTDVGAYEFYQHSPFITQPPLSQTVYAGFNASFTVAAIGDPQLAYQWQFDGTNLTGATNDSLTLIQVPPAAAGGYAAVVSNSFGVVTSSVATLTIITVPGFLTQPSNLVAMVLSNVVLSVTVTAAPPLSYQWLKNGTNLVDGGPVNGSSSPSLSISNSQPTDSGQYGVLVTNQYGAAMSAAATLTVVPFILWGNTEARVPAEATNLVAISAGGDSGEGELNLALRGDGTVVAWGDGSYASTNVPASATNVVAIAAGDYHGVALRKDGMVVGWGETAPPDGVSNVMAIASGQWHSLALRQDGTLTGWGDITPPAGISNVLAIAAEAISVWRCARTGP